jgi:hypothetical protein
MWRSGFALFALAGCSQVFGLDPPGLLDAHSTVTGRYYIKYPRNTAQHAIEIGEYVPPGLGVEVVFADGSGTVVAVGSDGSFEFERRTATEPYRVRFTEVAGAVPLEVQHDASHLEYVAYSGVRPDAPLAAAGTTIQYTISDATPTHTSAMYSTGQWMTEFGTTQAAGDYLMDWSRASTSGGAPRLLQTSHFDRAYFVLQLGIAGVQVLDRYRIDDIDLMSGKTHMIDGTTDPVSRQSCAPLDIPAATEKVRQDNAGFVAVPARASWFVFVNPIDMPLASSPRIAWAKVDPITDVTTSLQYGNPFPGVPVLTMHVARSFRLTGPNAIDIPVDAASGYTVPLRDCPTTTTIVPNVNLPGGAQLAGVALDADGKSIAIDRTKPLELTWERRGAGATDRSGATLYELTASGLVRRQSVLAVTNRIVIDPAGLSTGGMYVFLLGEELGMPGAASGDMTLKQPSGFAFDYTRTFTLTN